MSTRFLTEEDLERITKALAELNKRLDEFKPEIDDSDISGGYYIPSIDAEGDLSWSPSKEGMPAVSEVNIRGPRGIAGVSTTHKWSGTELTISSASGSSSRDLKGSKGDKGDVGPRGKSAYEYAKDGGYTGTEEEFTIKLAQEYLTVDDFDTFSDDEKIELSSTLSVVKNDMDEVAIPGVIYFLGEQTALTISLPDKAEIGQEISVVWYNTETPCDFSINGNVLNTYEPEANSRSELSIIWDGLYWSVLGLTQELPS